MKWRNDWVMNIIMNNIILFFIFQIRCVRSNGTIEYILDNLSPNATNYCPRQTDTMIIINEVHLTSTSQMVIELWDMGAGFTEMSKYNTKSLDLL